MAGMGARALYTWLTALIFLVLITLRLNMSMVVSWFVVLVPVWIYDVLMVVYIAIKLFKKDSLQRTSVFQRAFTFLWDFSGVFCLIVFQIFLCLKLDHTWLVPLRVIFIPIWVLCGQCLLKLGHQIYVNEKRHL